MTTSDLHIVIGAGSGMGEAVAARLGEMTVPLLLADTNANALSRVAESITGPTQTAVCDITSRSDLEHLRGIADAQVRSIVLTAGLSPTMGTGPRILEVDLVGPALMLDVFADSVGPATTFVLFASIAGHLQPPDADVDGALDEPLADGLLDRLRNAGVDVDDPGTAYMVAKRGLLRLVARTASKIGERGGRIVSVSPGIIDTPMGRQEADAQEVMADMVAATPAGRMLNAEEVAAVAVFLASDAASGMTGCDVLVDGGFVAQMTSSDGFT